MKPYKPIISFIMDYESVQANRIAPSGQRSRTSQSDRSLRTMKLYKPIRSLQIDQTVTGQKFRKDEVISMITDLTSDKTRRSFRKDQVIAQSQIARVTDPEVLQLNHQVIAGSQIA